MKPYGYKGFNDNGASDIVKTINIMSPEFKSQEADIKNHILSEIA